MIKHCVAVIPAHNEEQSITTCAAAVIDAACATHVPVDIVVALDACTDATADVIRRFGPRVRGVEMDYRNVGYTRRAGVAAALAGVPAHVDASETWIFSTDADSIVPPDWITRQLDLAARGADAVVGTVEPNWQDAVRPAEIHRLYERRYNAVAGHEHVHGANLGVRASAYLAAGGFDTLACSEDVALVEALRATGFCVQAVADIPVITSTRVSHRAPGGFSTYLTKLEALTGEVAGVTPAAPDVAGAAH